MSARRKIEVLDPRPVPAGGRSSTGPRDPRKSANRRGLRILAEIVLWVAGLGIFLTVGRMLGSTAPGLLAGLKVVLLNPIALVLLFGGGIALRIYLRRRRERPTHR